MDFPAKVYKFREFDEFTLMSIINHSVWFSSPTLFNDPFDCQFKLDETAPDKKDFDAKAESAFRAIASRIGKPITIRKPEACFEGESLSPAFVRNILNFKTHVEKQLRDIGVLSLSENPLNTTMWGHYAKSHTGICIEYETAAMFPKDEQAGTISKVTYKPASTINFNAFSLYARTGCDLTPNLVPRPR